MTALFLEALEALETRNSAAAMVLYEEEFEEWVLNEWGEHVAEWTTATVEQMEDGSLYLLGALPEGPVATIAEGKAMIAAYRKEVEIPEA